MRDVVDPKKAADAAEPARGSPDEGQEEASTATGAPPAAFREAPKPTLSCHRVRVVLADDDMTTAMVGIIETLGAAGLIEVSANDFDGGAVFDIPAEDAAAAEKLRRNLEAWHLDARLVPGKGS